MTSTDAGPPVPGPRDVGSDAAVEGPLPDVPTEADQLVPADSAASRTRTLSSPETEEFRMRGGHVGLTCGGSAARTTQPEVADRLARGGAAA